MDKPKTPKEEPQEKIEDQGRAVEEYQKKWDQMLQDTAKQIDKIRGEFFCHICKGEN
jgi:signal recognition particle subunit SEC65